MGTESVRPVVFTDEDGECSMIALPNLSGRESARSPGNPRKESSRASSGKVYTMLDEGMVKGDSSMPDPRNAGSYSKEAGLEGPA